MQTILDGDEWHFDWRTNAKNVAQHTISDYLNLLEKSTSLDNECHMNWMTDRQKTRKALGKLCFKDTIKNQYRIELLLAMEKRFVFRILNWKNCGLIRKTINFGFKTKSIHMKDRTVSSGNRQVNLALIGLLQKRHSFIGMKSKNYLKYRKKCLISNQ